MESGQSNTDLVIEDEGVSILEHQQETQSEPTPMDHHQTDAQSKAPAPKVPTGKKISWVWQYATKTTEIGVDGIEYAVAICNTCKKPVKADSKKYGTTNIANHLAKQCKKCPAYGRNVVERGQSIISQDTMGSPLVTHIFDQKKIDEKMVRFVIRDEHPFRVVEGVGFRELFKEACPRYRMPTRQKIASQVWDLYTLEKGKMMSVIENQRVSITTDTWTSIQNINYMVVSAHFMDSEWKLHKRIINFVKITSHKGDDIGRCLEVCLRNWGIEKVFSITVDNASPNDTAIDYMKKRLGDMNTLLFNGDYLHMRCACHILNLVVKDGLKDLQSSIEGIRNCAKYIHSSSARLDKFREYAVMFKMDSMSNICMDVPTRWNSTYMMLERSLKYKKVFARMGEEYAPFVNYFNEKDKNGKKRVGPPCYEDWDKSEAFVHFLKKFYDATLSLSATKSCTSYLMFSLVTELLSDIEDKIADDSNLVLQNVARSMKLKFNKYWGNFEDVNKVIYVAHVLDPRYKLQLIEISLEDIGTSGLEIKRITDAIKTCMVGLYDAYKKGFLDEGFAATTTTIATTTTQSSSISSSQPSRLSRAAMKLKRKREELEVAEITNEVDKYFFNPCEKLENDSFDILTWWKLNQSWYPILSKVAKDIFSIPSSTVASENAFSLGKRIVDPFRASLTPRMVEALVCSSDWLRADDFNFYKEPTDEEIAWYKDLEEFEATISNAQQTQAQA